MFFSLSLSSVACLLVEKEGRGKKGKGKGKAGTDLAHCFELHSGKLLGDKRNREGRLYFKVWLVFFCCVCVFPPIFTPFLFVCLF